MSIEKLHSLAAIARDLELEIEDLDSQIRDKKKQLDNIYEERMPELLDDLKLDNIGVAPTGNKPGMDFKLKPYYAANIAASWSEEKRNEAFTLLTKLKADDLIKTEVSSKLPKGSLKLAKQLVQAAQKLGVQASLKMSVHNATLTAWLKELYERRHQSLSTSDLEKIGGHVGRKVTPAERD